MKKNTWVVTLHFNRGNVLVLEFTDKREAQEAVRISVFGNEDCVNCSIYKVEKAVEDKQTTEEKVDNILQKAFQQNRKEWAQ